jgi:ATP-binding cassette, subfamily F, member 3
LLQAVNISHQFGPQTVLTQVSLQLTPHSRIGLVGRNGQGKSTLLNLMMQEMTPTEGHITITPGTLINRLTQHPRLTPGLTLQQELETAFTELNAAIAKTTDLEAQLAQATEEKQRVKLVNQLAETHQTAVRLGLGDRDARISRLIQGLGFALTQLETPVKQFSGGWQMRINLAKVLLQGADILLLDEPTNHLDLAACEWLEHFLKSYPGGLLIVSHDRQFLDAITEETAELDRGKLTLWPGNYSQYKHLKQEATNKQAAAAARQDKLVQEQMAFVNRFRASATKSTQAKSREKQLAKLERIEAPVNDQAAMGLAFAVARPSNREVLTLKNMAKGFNGTLLYQGLNATVERGHRVFILGDNGCGKSTLLRLLTGQETPDKGEFNWGPTVDMGYYAQHQLDNLDGKLTVYETLETVMIQKSQSQIRGVLGALLFKGDEVFKRVDVLSGGEKSRLALAKLLASGPNTLLLDEPTNHLDIPSQEVVEQALAGYKGTMVCISHDRQFIHRLATHIWEVHAGQLITFEGSYAEYLTKRDSLIQYAKPKTSALTTPPPAASSGNGTAPPKTSPLQDRKQLEKQLKKLEKAIMAKDQERSTLQAACAQPTEDYAKLGELTQTLQQVETSITALEAEWEQLAAVLV